MPNQPTPVDLFTYLDYRAFIRDWFEARKRSDKRFTHRHFLGLAGFTSSSALINVMSGTRNLSPESTESFARAMELDPEERAFFRALVALDQAATDDERNEAWALISAERRFRSARQLDGEAVRFLSQWVMPAIHQLAARDDFSDDPAWIAAALRPVVSEDVAREALASLQLLGLLARDEGGRLRPANVSVVTPREVEHLAVCNYHRQMATRALESVAAFPAEERHLLGVTVAVPAELVPQVKQELNRMQARLLDLCDSAEAPADRVYQINLQFVPLSNSRSEA
ncbi:MAG: TIGR02147 family protein [Alphaproteobacteria bacterium]|nr:TIGR02147 family protein [Alphaproteobacteria bacterium]